MLGEGDSPGKCQLFDMLPRITPPTASARAVMLKRISYGLRKRSTGERCFLGPHNLTKSQKAATCLTSKRGIEELKHD